MQGQALINPIQTEHAMYLLFATPGDLTLDVKDTGSTFLSSTIDEPRLLRPFAIGYLFRFNFISGHYALFCRECGWGVVDQGLLSRFYFLLYFLSTDILKRQPTSINSIPRRVCISRERRLLQSGDD
jgi:hypothetical protein